MIEKFANNFTMPNLKEYKEKRNFNRTKEPFGEKSLSKGRKFVIQYHEARAKHFDFRLENKGVLLSWAVPKGPSLCPKDKRLAIMVEDHPLDYANFEGTIPKGEYGGGTVMIWDEGTWKSFGSVEKGLKEGQLKFEIFGSRIFGKFALVKLEKNNWLLIKEKDKFCKKTSGISRFKTSIKTGRTISEIEKEETIFAPFKWAEPTLCLLQERVPKGEQWIYEVKYDGYRMICFLEGGKAALYSRNHASFNKKFPTILRALEKFFKTKQVVLDGEVILADENGKSDFGALQRAIKSKKEENLVYVVFDILALDGRDLRNLPLIERKKFLENVLKGAPSNILACQFVFGDGEKYFSAAKKVGFEGIVAKDKNSCYTSLRDGSWVKVKCYMRQEFAICGFTKKKGGKSLGSLILGAVENGKLVYVGRAGTGFSQKTATTLLKKFENFLTEKTPFKVSIEEGKDEKIFFLKPRFVAEVQFASFTKDGLLRQASFKGLREDKQPMEVKIEKPEKKGEKIVVCEVEISNPNRTLFKDKKIKKIDVVNYYNKVYERIAPFLENRILSVVRCHDENMKNCFFKKHPDFISEGTKEISVSGGEEKEKYFYITNRRGLISEVQLGTIEFHPWGSTVKNLERPDIMVFDLDPDERLDLEEVRRGALDLKKILNKLSLKAFLKTSGGKGYHIVVPFVAAADWEKFYEFSKKIATLMENRWPDRYTTNVRKNKRKGKIFIDFLRNNRGQTSVCPYSLRARKGGKVSAPISWSELYKISPSEIDMNSMLLRIEKRDPWKDFYKIKQKIK